MSSRKAVEVVEQSACVARRPRLENRSVPRPTHKRVLIGGVYYPPFMRQWDSRNEGPLAFQVRLAQYAGVQEISEYSWLRLMGRLAEAEIVLEQFVRTLRNEFRHEVCERTLAEAVRTHGEVLDGPFLVALRKRLRR